MLIKKLTDNRKRHRKIVKLVSVLCAISMVYSGILPVLMAGDIVPANKGTFKYNAENGVPVVNIATPNSKGLSHNKYNEFTVNEIGAVLNNTNKILMSQLAGAIKGNPNIKGAEAGIILNEVVRNNRSLLNGFIEVNGGRADVVVANPYGITTNGAGFINTSRVTLTTGLPNIANTGALTGFNVTTGDLLIKGKGVNATNQDFLDLVSREIKIEGQINTKGLNIAAGTNVWDYETQTAAAQNPTGAAPTYAVDSSLLGGMYANVIKLVATEAGVGVRMLGEMAASVDDMTVTSKGIIELKNKISSEKSVSVTYNGTEAGGKISISGDDTSISAKKDVTLSSSKSVEISKSAIVANNDLSITAEILTDGGSEINTRSADNNVTIDTTGKTEIDGTKWFSGNSMTADAGEFLIGSKGAQIYSGTDNTKTDKSLTIKTGSGDLDLATAKVNSANDIELTATTGSVKTSDGASQEIKAQNDVDINAKTGVTTGGKILAGNDITLRSKNSAGALSLTNSGRMQAGNKLDLKGYNGDDKLTIKNDGSGVLLGKKDLVIKASSLTNETNAEIQGTEGSTLDITGTLTNKGKLLVSDTAGENGTLNVGTLSNSGTLQGKNNVSVNVSELNSLTNSAGGKIIAGNDLTVRSTNNTGNLTLTNSGNMEAGNKLDLKGYNGDDKLTIKNDGLGVLLGKKDLVIKASSLTNETSAEIQGTEGSTLDITGTLTNKGKLIVSNTTGKNGTLNVGTLSNSAGGKILASNDLTVRSTNNTGNLTLTNSGNMEAGNKLDLKGYNGDDKLTIKNDGSGVLLGEKDLVFKAASLTNETSAKIQGTEGSTLDITGTLTNKGKLIVSNTTGKNGTLNVGTLSNSGTLQGKNNVSVNVSELNSLTNSADGKILASNDLTVRSLNNSGNLALSNSGRIQAGNKLDLKGYNGGDKLTIKNDGSGVLLGEKDLVFKAASLTNETSAKIQGTEGSTLDITGTLTNKGTLIVSDTAGENGTLNVGTLSNSGTLQGKNNVSVNVSELNSLTNSADGKILASNDLTVRSLNNSGNLALSNSGRMQADGALDLAGYSGGNSINVTNAANAVIKGGSAVIKSKTVSNTGTIQASDSTVNIEADTFENLTSDSLVLGGATGVSVLKSASGTITNQGAIHSNKDFTVEGKTIVTTDTSAMSALGTLIVDPDSDLENKGALYAGTKIELKSAGHTFTNASSGTIDGKDMALTAKTFTNYNKINADGNITITTTTGFSNHVQISGGTLVAESTTYSPLTEAEFKSRQDGAVTYDNTSSPYKAPYYYGSAKKFVILSSWFDDHAKRVQDSGVSDDANWSIYQHYDRHWDDDDTFSDSEEGDYYKLVKGQKKIVEKNKITGTATKSEIIAGGTLTIDIGGGNGENKGSILSANTINLNGNGSFTNDALTNTRDAYYSKYSYRMQLFQEPGSDGAGQNEQVFRRESSPGVQYMPDDKWVDVANESTAKAYAIANPELVSSEDNGGIGAGVFADTLNVNVVGSVVNKAGTKKNASTTSRNEAGAGSSGLTGGLSQTSLENGQSGSALVNGASPSNLINGVAVLGLNLNLPTNPNGFFVLANDPNAEYLIETNPRFGLDADYLGSDYLFNRLKDTESYKYNDTDRQIKRLGDRTYENKLIKDQIVAQTGRDVLSEHKNSYEQTKAMFDNAVKASEKLNLSWGIDLAPEQLSKLTQDIVWMVKRVVQGQEVLVPVVYLTEATLKGHSSTDATLLAKNMSIESKDFKNIGGTVEGSNKLNLQTKDDIENVSGTIKGGDLSLKSEEGSIKNRTDTQTIGGHTESSTLIGKEATIESTGKLSMDAKENIENTGAKIKSGGDALLTAGEDIKFDTIEDKRETNTYKSEVLKDKGGFYGIGKDKKTEETYESTKNVKNIGSSLEVGGNLDMNAKRDIVVEGSNIEAEGNANLNAGRDQKFIAKEDINETKTKTVTKEEKSGFKLSASSIGYEDNKKTTKTDKTELEGTAKVSSIKTGGDLKRTAKNELLDEGTKIDTGGDYTQVAEKITNKAAENRNETTETTNIHEEKKSIGIKNDALEKIVDSVKKGDEAELGAEAYLLSKSLQNLGGKGTLLATTSLEAELTITDTEKNRTEKSTTAVVSNINVGGKFESESKEKTTFEGTNVKAGKGAEIEAESFEFLAAKDTKSVTENTVTKTVSDKLKIGLETDKITKGKLGFGSNEFQVEKEKVNTQEESTKAKVGSLDAGEGDIKLTTGGGKIDLEGTKLATKKDIDVDTGGGEFTHRAAKDTESKTVETTTDRKTNTTSLGIEADFGKEGLSVEGALTNIYKDEDNKQTERSGNSTSITGAMDAGGDINIKAKEGIELEGTNIKGGGDFTAETDKFDYTAAKDTSYSETTSTGDTFTQTTKLAVGGDLSSGVGGKEKGKRGKSTGGELSLGLTIGADYGENESGYSEKSTTAHGGSLDVGGNIKIVSKGDATFEGTDLTAGEGADIKSDKGSVSFNAARDTYEMTSNSEDWNAGGSLTVGLGVGAHSGGNVKKGVTVDGSVSGDYSESDSREKSSTAKTGSINVGGDGLKVSARDNITLEGTDVDSKGKVDLDAKKGNLNILAAESTYEKKGGGFGAGGNVDIGMSGIGFQAEGEYNKGDIESSTKKVASVNAGKEGFNAKAGKDITFEGTNVDSKGKINIDAKGKVDVKAAENTYNETLVDLSGSVEFGSALSLSGKAEGLDSDKKTSTGAQFKSGGDFTLESGSDVTMEGTQIESGGKADISAKGDIDFKAIEDREDTKGGSVELGGGSGQLIPLTDMNLEGKYIDKKKQTGVTIKSETGVFVDSGGKITMEGAEVGDKYGNKVIKAKEGVKTSELEKEVDINFGFDTSEFTKPLSKVVKGVNTTKKLYDAKKSGTKMGAKSNKNVSKNTTKKTKEKTVTTSTTKMSGKRDDKGNVTTTVEKDGKITTTVESPGGKKETKAQEKNVATIKGSMSDDGKGTKLETKERTGSGGEKIKTSESTVKTDTGDKVTTKKEEMIYTEGNKKVTEGYETTTVKLKDGTEHTTVTKIKKEEDIKTETESRDGTKQTTVIDKKAEAEAQKKKDEEKHNEDVKSVLTDTGLMEGVEKVEEALSGDGFKKSIEKAEEQKVMSSVKDMIGKGKSLGETLNNLKISKEAYQELIQGKLDDVKKGMRGGKSLGETLKSLNISMVDYQTMNKQMKQLTSEPGGPKEQQRTGVMRDSQKKQW